MRRGRQRARRRGRRVRHGGAQRLARQHQIDRAARRGHRRLVGARDHVGDLPRHAQLVVPFDDLAQHAGLVEHFLRPVDRPAARTEVAGLGDRRAAGGEQQRHPVARQVDQVVDGVGGADVDVHHHRLGSPGHQIGAVRHGDREVLVRHQHRPRQPGVAGAGAAERLDDGREIGARIGEEEIDAVLGERAQENVAGDRGARRWGLRQENLPMVPSVLVDSGRAYNCAPALQHFTSPRRGEVGAEGG
jgi:hypothetical protein